MAENIGDNSKQIISVDQYGQYNVTDASDCVNLAVGQPSNKLLPLDDFNKALVDVSKGTNPAILQYGKIEGYNEFRRCLSKFLDKHYGTIFGTNYEALVVTQGITGALSLILSLYAKRGDTIFCEDPTYLLALSMFSDFGLIIKKVKITPNGIDVDELEEKLSLENSDRRVFLYTIPVYQNPTGYTMNHETRRNLTKIADKYPNLIVLADEVYHMLGFSSENDPLAPMHHYHKRFISMGSFSKIFAPALRMGWIYADPTFVSKIVGSGQMDSSGCVNPIGCAILHNLLINDKVDKSIRMWGQFLNANCEKLYETVINVLGKHIDTITKPNGGYFLWVKFKSYISTTKLAKTMEKYGIKFHYGNKFTHSGDDYYSCMRLSFSWYVDNEYEIGINRLAKLISDTYDNDSSVKNVYVLGHTGKLGSLIVNELNKSSDLRFIKGLGRDIDITGVTDKSIIIDVSQPHGTTALIEKLINKGIYCPLVIGVTGNFRMDLIDEYSKYAPVVISSNFSKGIAEFKNIIKGLNKDMWVPTLVESHHEHKKDSPSGTARTLAQLYGNDSLPEHEIISVRDGFTIGIHTLVLDSDNETITITHTAKTRSLFAEGSLHWMRWIANQNCGLYYEMN